MSNDALVTGHPSPHVIQVITHRVSAPRLRQMRICAPHKSIQHPVTDSPSTGTRFETIWLAQTLRQPLHSHQAKQRHLHSYPQWQVLVVQEILLDLKGVLSNGQVGDGIVPIFPELLSGLGPHLGAYGATSQ